MPDAGFFRALPKIELHAHLSGSVTPARLQEIWVRRRAVDLGFGDDLGLESPKVWFKDASRGQNIKAFFSHFNTYIYHLLSTPSALKFATQAVLEDFAADGVVYLELRTTPRALPDTSAEDAVRTILGVIHTWNTQPSTGSRMQARLILSIDRSKHSPAEAEGIVRLALRLRADGLPVVGVDLSGDPHASLESYRAAFQLAQSEALPASLHFAEIPSCSAQEMEELLLYRPSRLGHVIHVPEDVRAEIIRRGIHVELLLTCNILAGMLPVAAPATADVAQSPESDPAKHHFGWWYASPLAGVSIGTDDVGVFGSWVSDEYALVSRHFGLGEKELIGLVRRGIGGMFDEEEKGRVREELDRFEAGLASRR